MGKPLTRYVILSPTGRYWGYAPYRLKQNERFVGDIGEATLYTSRRKADTMRKSLALWDGLKTVKVTITVSAA